MMNNIRKKPPIRRLSRVLIICEGYEEYDYLSALIRESVWSDKLVISIKNAKSLDNVAGQYQYEYANGNYEYIFVFCDTEVPPYRQFRLLTRKINSTRGKNAAPDVICFANPCTMQIVLSHFERVFLETNQKDGNAPLIYRLTGVSGYRAGRLQREKIASLITAENYRTMKKNISYLETDYTKIPSTNAFKIFSSLESGVIKRN